MEENSTFVENLLHYHPTEDTFNVRTTDNTDYISNTSTTTGIDVSNMLGSNISNTYATGYSNNSSINYNNLWDQINYDPEAIEKAYKAGTDSKKEPLTDEEQIKFLDLLESKDDESFLLAFDLLGDKRIIQTITATVKFYEACKRFVHILLKNKNNK